MSGGEKKQLWGIDTMLPAPYFISPSLIRANRNGLSSCANVDAWKFSTCS